MLRNGTLKEEVSENRQAKRCAPSGLAPVGRLTADKREIKDFPKLPSATSFIRRTLYEIALR
jgi:hypothetical protein